MIRRLALTLVLISGLLAGMAPAVFAQQAGFSNYIQSLGGNSGIEPQLIVRGVDTNIDFHINPKGTGIVELGPPDSAAPTAETLGVSNVLAGTSNTAGVNLTIQGGLGTGTGVGGNILFTVGYPGSTGTAVNTASTVATLNGTNNAASGTTILWDISPTINGSGTNLMQAFRVNVTETAQGSGVGQLLNLSVGGTMRFAVTDGLATVGTQIRTAQATVPTCTTNCGSPGNVVAGSDTAGLITMGTTPASAFVVAFNGTWASAPVCHVTMGLVSMVTGKKAIVVATTTTQFTVTTDGTAPVANDLYQYICMGKT